MNRLQLLLGFALLVVVSPSLACAAPSPGARGGLLPTALDGAGDARAVHPALGVPADVPDDPCATAFRGPHYDAPVAERPASKLGQPATLLGATSALCGGDARCRVSMLLPAGRDDDTDEDRFVSRVDSALQTKNVASGCGSYVDYFLVVAKNGRIAGVRHLVETGDTCMHWRDEQVTVGSNLFVWRDSGYGSPTGDKAWESRHVTIELSTLRVDGCAPPPAVLRGPLVRHPFG